MPIRDDDQVSQFLIDALLTCETESLSSNSSDAASLERLFNSSTPLPDLPNAKERIDDNNQSPSPAVDPEYRIDLVEEKPHPRAETESPVSFSGQDNAKDSPITRTRGPYYPHRVYPSEPPKSCGMLGWYYMIYGDVLGYYRVKGYLVPFELICLPLAIACCYMGAAYWESCSANLFIPRFLFFNGVLATFSLCLRILYDLFVSCVEDDIGKKYWWSMNLGWAAVIGTFIEMAEFYNMSFSFDRIESDYCDKEFYWFVHYKNIAFGVIMVLVVALCIPGSDNAYDLDESSYFESTDDEPINPERSFSDV